MAKIKKFRVTILLTIILFVMFSSITACTPKPIKPEYSPTEAKELARKIVNAKSLNQAAKSVKVVLALGGIGTAGSKGWEYEPLEPASSIIAINPEVMNLALEAQLRETAGRMTLEELGEMLTDFGWPFPEGKTPGEHLVQFLSVWVKEAAGHQEEAESFTPMFLKEMALLQTPKIDLEKGDYQPSNLWLTTLELQLIAGAINREFRSPEEEVKPFNASSGTNTAYAADVCDDFKKWLGPGGEIIYKEVYGGKVKNGINQSLKSMGVSPENVKIVGKMLDAVNMASKIWRLINLYSSGQVKVSVLSENPLHKKLESEGKEFTAFKAEAGINEDDWEEYRDSWQSSDIVKNIRSCLKLDGFPVMPDLGDLAAEAEKWTVRWSIIEGSPEHGTWGLDNNPGFIHNGQVQTYMNLKRESKTSASATFVVDLTPEKGESHSGEEKSAPLTVKAEVDTTQVPIGALKSVIKSNMAGLIPALVELGAGWAEKIFPIKNYATVTLTYHDPQWKGTIISDTDVSIHLVEGSYHDLTIKQKYKLEITLGELVKTSGNSVTFSASTKTTGTMYLYRIIHNPEPYCHYEAKADDNIDIKESAEVTLEPVSNKEGTYRLKINPPKTDPKLNYIVLSAEGVCTQAASTAGIYDQPLKYFREGTTIEVKVDPANPNRIVGSKTYDEYIPVIGGVVTEDVSWDLRRK